MSSEDRREEKKALIEAVLFLENQSVEYKQLATMTEIPQNELQTLITELQSEYELRAAGLEIIEIAEGFQMIAHPRLSLALSKLYGAKKKSRLSQSNLETLAIIAYKQPITKAEIERLRGVSSERAIKVLMEKDLITIVSRREGPGKPLEFGTTREFLRLFGLKTVKDLPRLKELKELEFSVSEAEQQLRDSEIDEAEQDEQEVQEASE